VDDDTPLIDDIGIARLIAKLRAIRDHDPNYGVTKTEFLARAQEIAVRQALRDQRRLKRQQRLERPIDGMLPSQIPAAPSFVDQLIAAMDLRILLGRLTQDQHQVIILSLVMKRPIPQIAVALGLSVRTVRRLRRTALDTLQNHDG
jgi:RNA polymerase sigma factor (sigma-70 family)